MRAIKALGALKNKGVKMKKIIFGLMFCAVAISSVYALDEALVAKATEIEKKKKNCLMVMYSLL